jgi:type II secretory pathway component PulF
MNTQVPQYQYPSAPQMQQMSQTPVKSETCSSMWDLFTQYWWILLIIVLAYLYYMYQQKKQNHEEEYSSSNKH